IEGTLPQRNRAPEHPMYLRATGLSITTSLRLRQGSDGRQTDPSSPFANPVYTGCSTGERSEQRHVEYCAAQAIAPPWRNPGNPIAQASNSTREAGGRISIVAQRNGCMHRRLMVTLHHRPACRVQRVHHVASPIAARQLVRLNAILQFPSFERRKRIKRP